LIPAQPATITTIKVTKFAALAGEPKTAARVERVIALTDDFTSMYGWNCWPVSIGL
jgi:hypothetical protein